MTEKERAFLIELRELTLRHGIYIDGCGCCDSPFLEDNERAKNTQGGYTCSENGGNVKWLSPDETSDYAQQKWKDAVERGELAIPVSQEDIFTVDDYAYALAQLTDDCELAWISKYTGLSNDECEKIMRISYAAQKRTLK